MSHLSDELEGFSEEGSQLRTSSFNLEGKSEGFGGWGNLINKSRKGHDQVRFRLGDQGRDLAGLGGSCLVGDSTTAAACLLLSVCLGILFRASHTLFLNDRYYYLDCTDDKIEAQGH